MTSPPPGAPPSDALAMRVIALLRRLPSGRCTVAPINAPQLTAYGPDGVATADLRLFLSEHLALLPAEQVARFAVSERARLEEVDVLLPREDLPRRIQIDTPLRVPCVVVPDGKHAWVIVVPLRHTFYLRDDESLDESVRAEVTRLVGAMELPPEAYLRLHPARAHGACAPSGCTPPLEDARYDALSPCAAPRPALLLPLARPLPPASESRAWVVSVLAVSAQPRTCATA
jgi:hypothetical protein